jgi:hypothetical protein
MKEAQTKDSMQCFWILVDNGQLYVGVGAFSNFLIKMLMDNLVSSVSEGGTLTSREFERFLKEGFLND